MDPPVPEGDYAGGAARPRKRASVVPQQQQQDVGLFYGHGHGGYGHGGYGYGYGHGHGYGHYGGGGGGAQAYGDQQRTTYREDTEGNREFSHERRRVARGYQQQHHRHGDDWTDDGLGLCTIITVTVFFLFFVVIALASAGSRRPYPYGPYYGGGAGHTHPLPYPGYPVRMADPSLRRKGQCTVGEWYADEYEQCVPHPVFPQGVDLRLRDVGALACDDFERHACGSWDDDRAHVGESRAFTYIQRENDHQVGVIVRNRTAENPGAGERPNAIHRFYRSCVETLVEGKHKRHVREARRHQLDRVLGEFRSMGDLAETLGRMLRKGFVVPFHLGIDNHPTEPRMVPAFRFDGFPRGMDDALMMKLLTADDPNRATARGKMGRIKEMLAAFQAHRPPPEPGTQEAYAAYLQGPQFRNDMVKWGAFRRSALGGDFNWDVLLQRMDGHQLRFDDDQDVWVVLSREHFGALDLHAFGVGHWRNYLEFSVLYATEEFFPDIPDNAYFRAHTPLSERLYARMERLEDKRSGTDTMKRGGDGDGGGADAPPRPMVTELQCVRAAEFLLPGLVSREFIKMNFGGRDTERRVVKIVEDVRDQVAIMQSETPFLDAATRDAIVHKTRSIKVRVGHPTHMTVEPFADSISGDDYVWTLCRVREYRVQRDLERWRRGGELDRDEFARFGGSAATVNAWYSPMYNVITIYPGILKFPFYHHGFDDASAMAGIGMVVGHELGHSGDPQGVEYDEEGSFSDTWGPEAKEALHERFQCIEREYEVPAVPALPETCRPKAGYGKRVAGEAAADRIGIEAAWRAWLKRRRDAGEPPVTKHQAQMYFLSYGQCWCGALTPGQMCARVRGDPHPLASERVRKTVRNFPPFKWAWGCSATAPMVNHRPSGPCAIYGDNAKLAELTEQ